MTLTSRIHQLDIELSNLSRALSTIRTQKQTLREIESVIIERLDSLHTHKSLITDCLSLEVLRVPDMGDWEVSRLLDWYKSQLVLVNPIIQDFE